LGVAYTQAEIDELKRIRATGALRAKFADREVEYRSLEEIDRIIADMERAVNGTSSYRLASTSKGL
jgi:hypothetical protein